MILTAALNLRWHKACKKELSVTFIISKKVPLEAEEWPCSAGGKLTETLQLQKLGWRWPLIRGTKIMHQTHSFKSSKNDLKKTFRELAYCLSLLAFKEIPAWLKYLLGRTLERLLCTQRPSECGGNWRLMGKFIEWILFSQLNFHTFI